MERREFLVSVSQLYQGESEKLKQLCQLYKIPEEIKNKIKSPIRLFSYLDIEETLSIKTLAQNLKRSELYEMASYVDKYKEKKTIEEVNDDNPTARVVKILRDGLTLKNIYDLNYLLGTKRKCNEFDTLLIGLLTKSKFMEIDIEYIANVMKIIKHHDVADKLTNYPKKKESLRVSWENDERRRLTIINISQKLTNEDITNLAFLFRLPMRIKDTTNPIDLFQYLEDRGELNLSELTHYLEILQKTKLTKELEKYIMQSNEYNSNQICFSSIFEEINDSLTREEIFNLGFLLGSKKYPKTTSDYIIQLIEKGKIQNLDLKFLNKALKEIHRDDLLHIIYTVVGNQNVEKNSIINGESTSIEGETQRIQLLEISRNISTEELEKLSIIYNVPPAVAEAITMPIELFYYLERESQFDVEYLKMSLSSIQRKDLINILEPQ